MQKGGRNLNGGETFMNRIDFLFAREVMAAGSYAVDFGVAALMKQCRHTPISGVRRIFLCWL